MSLTDFVLSIGCVPEEEDLKKIKKEVPLEPKKEDHVCKYCGILISQCLCTRTQHVFNYKTGKCDLCGESFKPNGTGPKGKWYTFLIRIFPFNRWVDDISDLHDIEYFEGYTRFHKNVADFKMFDRTKKKIEKTWWLFPTKLWVKRARVNYLAVNGGGDDSFNWSGCLGEYKKPVK